MMDRTKDSDLERDYSSYLDAAISMLADSEEHFFFGYNKLNFGNLSEIPLFVQRYPMKIIEIHLLIA